MAYLVRPICQQTARASIVPSAVDRGQLVTGREGDDRVAMPQRSCARLHHQSAIRGERLAKERVPTANPKPLTATANRLILAANERSLQVDLVRLDRTVQVAGCVGSRDPGPSTPTQRAAAQIPEAIGVRQY